MKMLQKHFQNRDEMRKEKLLLFNIIMWNFYVIYITRYKLYPPATQTKKSEIIMKVSGKHFLFRSALLHKQHTMDYNLSTHLHSHPYIFENIFDCRYTKIDMYDSHVVVALYSPSYTYIYDSNIYNVPNTRNNDSIKIIKGIFFIRKLSTFYYLKIWYIIKCSMYIFV